MRHDEVRNQHFLKLDFGLPTSKLAESLQECIKTGEPQGPVPLHAVNRKGRSLVCTVMMSPLDGTAGVVILMDAGDDAREAGAPDLQ